MKTLLYGPADGDWVDLVALEGAGFLIDCMEISAHILGIRAKRLLLCAGCRDAGRRKICQRSGGLLQADLSIGILPSEERSRTVTLGLVAFLQQRAGFLSVALDGGEGVIRQACDDQFGRVCV